MKDIHKLIESYFDCTLSEQEERELKTMLATTAEDSDDIREAKAVLGVFAMQKAYNKHNSLKAKAPRRLSIVKYAAAAALALLVGFSGMQYINSQETDICVMYADGQTIKNEDAIFAQMASELSVLGDAAESTDNTVTNQLAEMANLID